MLRTHIPSAAKHKKMSKVDTLRHAVEYIQSLNRMLNRNDSSSMMMSEIDSEASSSSPDPVMKVETPTSPLPPTPEDAQQTILATTAAPPMSYNENYESGYETSSYYSTCNSMISPVPDAGYAGYSEYNPPVSDQRQYFYNHQTQQPLVTSGIEPNSEEDELLDAIANWQDS